MSKKETPAKAAPGAPKTLEELILNYPGGKYTAIPLAAQWAKVLRRREEHRHLTSNEILDLALKDVLGGAVDWDDVRKALAANGVAEPGDALKSAEEKSRK